MQEKIVNKQYIEDRIILECRELLTNSNIERIAASVSAACEADYDSSAVKRLRAFLHSLKKGNINEENNRKGIINIFLRAIYLYDDKMAGCGDSEGR